MTNLASLLNKAAQVRMTKTQKEEQRQSFAYGNTNIENPLITKEMVRKEAEEIRGEQCERD